MSGRAVPSRELTGAHEFALPPGAKARMELENSALAFQVTAGSAGRAALLAAPLDLVVLIYYAFSALLHVGLLTAVYYWTQNSKAGKLKLAEEVNPLVENPFLTANSEPEREEEKPKENQEKSDSPEGAPGTKHAGEEGKMGDPTKAPANLHWALKKRDDSDPHFARNQAISEAQNFGLVGTLAVKEFGSMGPTAFDGADTANGTDNVDARGNMFGAAPGDAFGNGGLGLSGVGEGGGGSGSGIGLGNRGWGRGANGKGNQGIGSGRGGSGDGHKVGAPQVRGGIGAVSGRLPKDVIQRIVRQNFGRFRQCYLNGLAANPSLTGTVNTRFIISRSGAVAGAQNAGSNMPDGGVTSCVVSGFLGLSFPAPDNGTVTVDYPITFSPE